MKFQPSILLAVLVWTGPIAAQSEKSPLAKTDTTDNIVWTTPSKNSTESMPLSGGLLGLNVWVENGELRVLMASTDSQDEMGIQAKAGLLVVKAAGGGAFTADFRQELRLDESEIIVSGKTAVGTSVELRVWCVANQPVFHVRMQSGEPLEVEVHYESWAGHQMQFKDGNLQWMRRNAPENAFRNNTIKAQKMEAFAKLVPDPLSNLTVGGLILAPGLVPAGTGEGQFNGMKTAVASLKTAKPLKKLDMTVTLRMEQDASVPHWEEQLAQAARQAAQNTEKDRVATLAWWRAFWDRSHIRINPQAAGTGDKGWLTGRNYRLGRYQLAANVSGRMPSLFNGGSFACDHNPDRRKWDFCYYIAQNMRLLYWPLLKTGDFDAMRQPFEYYRERTPMQRAYAKQYWGIEGGQVFPEIVDPFGVDPLGVDKSGRSRASHLRYHYTGCMDFAYMMLQYAAFSGEDIKPYLPFIDGIVRYYDAYYQREHAKKARKPLDDKGRLVIYPSDALEVGNEATNSVTDITGLTAIARGLLALPPGTLSADEKNYYKGFLSRIPVLTLTEKLGKKIIAPAEKVGWIFYSANMEFPELYVCFPFDHFFLGRKGEDGTPGIELAKNTWDVGGTKPSVQKQSFCWYQSAINLARMGRAKEAMQYSVNKMVLQPALRFPAFYSTPGFCCVGPDTDHIGAGMIGIQEMLMQTDGRRILLTPAWPAHWDCDFKLHAPFGTVVEGRVVGGKVIVDKVTPEARRKDIEMYEPAVIPVSLAEGKKATASGVWGAGYEADKAVDGNDISRWSTTAGVKTSWLEVDLGEPMAVARAMIKEVAYPSVGKFALEVQEQDGSWRALTTGTTLGANKEMIFEPVKAQKFRLHVLDSATNASIEEFQLFEK